MIQQELNMRKLSAKCLPRNPKQDQKYMCMMCQGIFSDFGTTGIGFFSWTVTQDEMLVHHFDPETEQLSTQLKRASSLFLGGKKNQGTGVGWQGYDHNCRVL